MSIDPLTAVYWVSDAMLAEFGLFPVHAPVMRCTDAGSVPLPLADLRWPAGRAFDPDRLRRLLHGIASGSDLPAVPVYREAGATIATVLDGAHRLPIIRALGGESAPCVLVSRDEAEILYAYPDGQGDLL